MALWLDRSRIGRVVLNRYGHETAPFPLMVWCRCPPQGPNVNSKFRSRTTLWYKPYRSVKLLTGAKVAWHSYSCNHYGGPSLSSSQELQNMFIVYRRPNNDFRLRLALHLTMRLIHGELPA